MSMVAKAMAYNHSKPSTIWDTDWRASATFSGFPIGGQSPFPLMYNKKAFFYLDVDYYHNKNTCQEQMLLNENMFKGNSLKYATPFSLNMQPFFYIDAYIYV